MRARFRGGQLLLSEVDCMSGRLRQNRLGRPVPPIEIYDNFLRRIDYITLELSVVDEKRGDDRERAHWHNLERWGAGWGCNILKDGEKRGCSGVGTGGGKAEFSVHGYWTGSSANSKMQWTPAQGRTLEAQEVKRSNAPTGPDDFENLLTFVPIFRLSNAITERLLAPQMHARAVL